MGKEDIKNQQRVEFNRLVASTGITKVKIAEIADVSPVTVSAMVAGRSPISPLLIDKLRQIDKIINFKEEKKTNRRNLKKIIDGKLYNTQSAKMLAEYSNGLGNSDFRNLSEELYRTKTGAFFLAGNGGSMTKYSESCGDNSYCGGEKIIPISEAEAREWLEKYGTTEEYETIFGEPPEA